MLSLNCLQYLIDGLMIFCSVVRTRNAVDPPAQNFYSRNFSSHMAQDERLDHLLTPVDPCDWSCLSSIPRFFQMIRPFLILNY